MNKIIRAAAVA